MSAKYPSLAVVGGLFSADLIDDIAEAKAAGQRPRDFGFSDHTHLIDQISATWSDARGFWQSFRRRLERLQAGETGVSFTRAQWITPLFSLLGYDLTYQERAVEADGQTYAISHRADAKEAAPPVHVVGAFQSLDRRAESGRPRLAPHSLVQEYLNRTEHLWGIVTNGLALRLLRDSQLLRRQAYLEFDLRTMFEGEHFADFALFYRLLHRSRLPHADEKPEACFLERWYTQTVEQGGRVRERLRDGVEEAIKRLADGLLRHKSNTELRQAAAGGRLTPARLYEQLLRLIYRLLFLMVTEERNLLCANRVYRDHYSVNRLRRLAEIPQARNQHDDLWVGLQSTFRLFHSEELGRLLDVPPLDGDLFDLNRTEDLNSACLSNRDFLEAVWHLSIYREGRRAVPRRINYAALDVEELGSVYESLLDLQPVFTHENGQPGFQLIKGTERKTTGSYYTHPELVEELVKSALVPVMEDRLRSARAPNEKERAILEITVCDPACGSGHFLLAAARRLARELARIRSGEEEPSPREYRLALRDVITHCIYGVDKNPLAVELCKVALWLESHAEGKPLTFLDHRILCGDSLVGVRDLVVLRGGIPDDAFKPVTGDDKDVAREVKRRNRSALRGQRALPFTAGAEIEDLVGLRRMLLEIPDDTPEQIQQKRKILERWRSQDGRYWRDRTAADLWTCAFFVALTQENLNSNSIPTTENLLDYLEGRCLDPRMPAEALAQSMHQRFFHWPLEFPEVFARGGFDVILCNPPWERIKLSQEEFFSTRDLSISRAPNKAARERLIRDLPRVNPGLWREYSLALHDAEALSRFLRGSGSYPSTARGDINTYSVFAERLSVLVRPEGRVGAVVPTGIATDDTNKEFFASIATTGRLATLYDFENRQGLFPAVDSRMKFSLLTIRGAAPKTAEAAQFAFFLTRAEQLGDRQRVFSLTPDDFDRLNPNTRTCPIFRTRADAELTRRIYQRIPVLVKEATGENPWGVSFLRMFDMSNDSHLFRTREWLEEGGFRLSGNRFVKGREVYLPLYEAKMIHQFNHRFGDYSMRRPDDRGSELPEVPRERLADASQVVQPRYWVSEGDLRELGQRSWFVAFRDVTRATDERTAIFSLLPRVGVGNAAPLMFSGEDIRAPLIACLLANVNSLTFDYVTRQKLGGTNLTYFILKQLPVLAPSSYQSDGLLFVAPRAVELACTAWDIQPFLDDVWREADNSLRAAIERQWCENREATGGHSYDPPEWYTPPKDHCPLPPFKWDEDRRARLRAELDAYYARLYGLDERDLRYILDPQDVFGPDFPGETFRVLKEKETARYGEYRTRRLVLEAWERAAATSGVR